MAGMESGSQRRSIIERIRPFRRSGWPYFFVTVASIFIVVVFIVTFLLVWKAPRTPEADPYLSTPRGRADQLSLLNIINRFQLDEESADQGVPSDERIGKRLEHVQKTLVHLRNLDTESSVEQARNDLIALFGLWEEHLLVNDDTRLLRDHFVAVGRTYPWLNTLMWIILLNRL